MVIAVNAGREGCLARRFVVIEQHHAHSLVAGMAGDDDSYAHALSGIADGEPTEGRFIGIKALMLAVLDDAIVVYLGRAGRARDEAETWIEATGRRSPFAFAVICEMLGLEPGAVRVVLRRWRASTVQPRRALRRTRRNAKATGTVAAQPPPL